MDVQSGESKEEEVMGESIGTIVQLVTVVIKSNASRAFQYLQCIGLYTGS